MKSERGQVLVVFILLLPLFFLLIGFLFDIGSMMISVGKIESTIEEALDYAVENKKSDTLEDDIARLLNENIELPHEQSLKILEDKIEITIQVECKGTFKHLFGKTLYQKEITKKKEIKKD